MRSMLKHEQKICPRCGQIFECKVGDILKCQCYGITVTAAMSTYIAQKYNECLCRHCLLEIEKEMETPPTAKPTSN